MTEAEWLACTDPWPMLEYLGSKASARKLRLFMAACCWIFCRLMPEERWRRGVETIERIADGSLTPQEALHQNWGVGHLPLPPSRLGHVGESAIVSAAVDPEFTAFLIADRPEMAEVLQLRHFAGRVAAFAVDAVRWSERDQLPWFRSIFRWQRRRFTIQVEAVEKRKQALLLRDIFGNPFRSVTLAASSLTPAVVSLAQAAYEERDLPSGHLDPVRLAVLADAVEEEAGCTDAELLGHLRQPGQVHVRGCWGVDLILDKS